MNAQQITPTERAERYRATRGYLSDDGIVACGECVDNQRYAACGDVAATVQFAQDGWVRVNPVAGDDFCSICDKDITGKWENA